MRVLHILNELKPSGAEVMLYAAAPYWRARGIEGEILATGNRRGVFASLLEEAGYCIHHIPFAASYTFIAHIYRLLKDNNYDALHIHTERANFWYALLGYLSGNRKIVRTIHNVFSFEGKLRVERLIQRWIMRRTLAVKMISISSSVRENESRTFHNDSVRVPNWFNSARFKAPSKEIRSAARKALDICESAIVFTSVGGCSDVKNHSSIIEALAGLPAGVPVLYLHVGAEMEGYPERRLAHSLDVAERVRFCGTIRNVELTLQASDVYVMPSLYEGCPISAIEAMATGLPAILSDVPGLRDFREAGEGIYWVNPAAESIRKALLQSLEMPPTLRREKGLTLSTYAHERFAIEKGAEAYGQLYKGQPEPKRADSDRFAGHTGRGK